MKPLITLTGVNKAFFPPHKASQKEAKPIEVLKDINISISAGERVAIVGPSGSGKTTLLSLLAGLERPDCGSITFKEQLLEKMSQAKLSLWRAKNLGIVFQQYHLLPYFNAIENVLIALHDLKLEPKKALEQAVEILKAVGLEHRLDHFPSQLSGGECQRVAIARALVHKPALLLADEPSGNLDTNTGNSVMRLLFDLVSAQKTTLILVTHNEHLAQQCDRVLQFQMGQLT